MNALRTRLLASIAARTDRTPALTDRLDRIGVDSIEMADLLAKLEQDFGFRADADVFDVETVADLADYIEARQR